MKPTGIGLGEARRDDIVLLDLDGRRIRGDGPVHHEVAIHIAVYRARPDVNAVVHTHPLAAAALAASDADLQIVSQDAIPFAAGIGIYDSAELVVDDVRGASLAAALGDHPLVLMRNHGITAVDATVQGATCLAIAFDRTVQIQLIASQLGGVRTIDPDEAERMRDYFARSYGDRTALTFEYLRRRLTPPRAD
jgi:L-fuculose-phosphate aldolase